jgi:hypothetical protein
MFVPGLIALASIGWATGQLGGWATGQSGGWATGRLGGVVVSGVAAVLAYLVAGSAFRVLWLDDVLAGDFQLTVRLSAAVATLAGAAMWWHWTRGTSWLATARMATVALATVVVVTVGIDLAHYREWATTRTFLNYEASRAVGTLLPPGSLVHGKLANGLSLENQIAPIFIGRGFGNYADRLDRDDARYILSYTVPEPGYEGEVILDVLQHYPQRRVIAEFDVQETPGPDRAALIDKFPDGPDPRARNQ